MTKEQATKLTEEQLTRKIHQEAVMQSLAYNDGDVADALNRRKTINVLREELKNRR